jgi:hypothetical protein
MENFWLAATSQRHRQYIKTKLRLKAVGELLAERMS